MSLGRNEPCHCGSGKKYKRCCLRADEAVEREEHLAAEAAAPDGEVADEAAGEAAAEVSSAPGGDQPRRPTDQPWKRDAGRQQAYQRFMTPPRRGGS